MNVRSSVLLVDDHPIVRQGIRRLIEKESDLFVSGEADDVPEAVSLIERAPPDIVLLDLSLKATSGFDLILDIQARWPALRILVLSMYSEDVYAERVVRAGAAGYIMKQEAPRKVIAAIRRVLGGSLYVSEQVSATLLTDQHKKRPEASSVDRLTDRELQVFQLLGEGLTHQQIAERLMLSIKTIESHVEHLKGKLSVGSGRELFKYAIEWVMQSKQKSAI